MFLLNFQYFKNVANAFIELCTSQKKTISWKCHLLMMVTLVINGATNFQRRIHEILVKHLTWAFLQKKFGAKSRKLFLKKVPSYMFDWVLNSSLYLVLDRIRSSHGSCSLKKVFLKLSQNSQENTCAI